MFEFEKVCKEVERMDPLTYSVLLAETSARVVAALSHVTEDGIAGITIFKGLVLGAIVSDGKLSEEEFILVKPTLEQVAGEEVTFEDAKALLKYFKPETKDYKVFVDAVVDLFGELSDELKADLVTVCLLVCAADGKISMKERMWLKQLIR